MTDRTLSEKHQRLIDASAISIEVSAARGYFTSESKSELVRLGFGKSQAIVPALVLPVHDVHGAIATYQIRPDSPRTNARGRVRKYETPTGTRMLIDVPPTVRLKLGDPSVTLLVTEGARKADAAVTAGLACVALLGVDGWRGKNAEGGITAIACWESIALNGRTVVIAFDSDIVMKPDVQRAADRLAKFLTSRKAIVKIVLLPEGPNGTKVGLDDYLAAGHTATDLMALIPTSMAKAREIGTPAADRAGPYAVDGGRIVYFKPGRDGDTVVPLCNFDARIVAEEVRDDGAESELRFRIEGALARGPAFPSVVVPGARFASLAWIPEHWGVRALVFAGQGTREHLRTAIQSLSFDAARTTVFAHTGWRRIEGQLVYLHAGGAIAATGSLAGITVDLPDALSRYVLPDPASGEELRDAVSASLTLLDLAPLAVTVPLHAAIFRGVLGDTDFGVHLAGETGVFKSELVALVAQHYGAALNRLHLAGWSSTANSLEGIAFAAKDAVFVIDDFAPRGTTSDVQRLHKEADRLFRAQGNRAGRMRMRADGSLRPEKPPRGLILSTGEDVPGGHSIRARLVIVEVNRGDVDVQKLSVAQAAATEGRFAEALAGFICWLAVDLPARQREIRDLALGWRGRGFAHRRTSDALGALAAGHTLFRRFAVEVGALTLGEESDLESRVDRALLQLGEAQASLQASEDPVRRFFELLGGALVAGEAHVEDADATDSPPCPAVSARPARPASGTVWGWRRRTTGSGQYEREEDVPLGKRIGWVRGDDLYLDPDSAFRVAQGFASGQGVSIALSARTLWKRLLERGHLVTAERGRSTIRPEIQGRRPRVLHFRADVLSPTSGPSGPSGQKDLADAQDEAARPDSGPLDGPLDPPNGPANGPRTGHGDDPAGSPRHSGPLGPLGPLVEGIGGSAEKVVIDL